LQKKTLSKSANSDPFYASSIGVVIGRGGATIAEIRENANVKAGVSKVVPGVPDRVLSIGGTTESVAKVSNMISFSQFDCRN